MKHLPTLLSVAVASVALLLHPYGLHGAESAPDAATFVCRLYKHGVPYVPARAYSGADVAALRQVLADPANEAYWPNAIITLGIIGDAQVTQPLVDFLERRFQGEVNLHQFNALLSVPLALGHAAMHGNAAALDYLLNTHTIEAWEAKALPWTFQKYRGERRSVLVAKMAIRGLAFACKPESRELLVRMRDSERPEYVRLRAQALANITEAIEFYDLLAEQGPERTFVFPGDPPPAPTTTPPEGGAPPSPDPNR